MKLKNISKIGLGVAAGLALSACSSKNEAEKTDTGEIAVTINDVTQTYPNGEAAVKAVANKFCDLVPTEGDNNWGTTLGLITVIRDQIIELDDNLVDQGKIRGGLVPNTEWRESIEHDGKPSLSGPYRTSDGSDVLKGFTSECRKRLGEFTNSN